MNKQKQQNWCKNSFGRFFVNAFWGKNAIDVKIGDGVQCTVFIDTIFLLKMTTENKIITIYWRWRANNNANDYTINWFLFLCNLFKWAQENRRRRRISRSKKVDVHPTIEFFGVTLQSSTFCVCVWIVLLFDGGLTKCVSEW